MDSVICRGSATRLALERSVARGRAGLFTTAITENRQHSFHCTINDGQRYIKSFINSTPRAQYNRAESGELIYNLIVDVF